MAARTIRRAPWWAVMVGTAGLAFAQEPKPPETQPQPAAQPEQDAGEPAFALPLTKVVLFSSGVGFFEHNGDIQGSGHVDLKFNVDDINDLLKSMVLEDLGGGQISTVTYGSKDPITKALKTFAIDLTENPTLADLLRQIRGERVQVEAPTPITGVILGVERRAVKISKDESIEQDYLNLLTDEGLRSVALESVSRIRLLDEALNAELQQALAVLAMGHSTDKKTVSLAFLGAGVRPVRVGYIQESPIWKTSYRLVLRDKEAPFLQGWAIVENTTEEDWNDVDLTLVSGRPISFVMDLYQPLYVPRPVVVPELYASLQPQTYGQDMGRAEEEFAETATEEDADMEFAGEAFDGPAAPPPMAARKARGGLGGLLRQTEATARPFDPTAGVRSVAQSGDVGELFRYSIANPVTLPRQQSAMLPIVNDSVAGEKLSIYNPAVHGKHPLNGLRLKNTSGLHLMQGPVTVFDGGAYAGDARIEDLQPGTERLISYALDLDIEVAPESKSHPEELISVQINRGTLITQRKYTREQKYTVKNSGKETKTVLIEQTFDANWKLVAPQEPSEKTRDLYRFAVTAEPGKPAELAVREEQVSPQQVALTNLDDGTIQFYIRASVTSEAVKTALADVIKRKAELQNLVNQRGELERQMQVVEQEQNRIRQNMAQLDRNSDLYNRYVKKFGEQEDMVDQLRKSIQESVAKETASRQSLNDYLSGLELK